MTRTAITLDRLLAFLIGVVLVAVGGGALIWRTGLGADLPQVIAVPAIVNAIDTPWWRWAIAGAGLLCTVIALRWLIAHLPARRATPIRLAEDMGSVSIDPAAIANAAAGSLERHPVVRSAKGRTVTDRGTRTIEIAVTAVHPDELAAVVAAVDDTCAHIAQATGDVPMSVRTTLHIKGGRALTRARLR